MASKSKFIAIAVFIIVLATSTHGKRSAVSEQNAVSEIAEDILQTINSTLSEIVENLYPDFEEIQNQLDSLQEEALKLAKRVILEEVQNLNESISTAEYFLADNTISQCLTTAQQQLSLVQAEANDDAYQCIQIANQAVADDTLKAVSAFLAFKNAIAKDKNDLDACKGDTTCARAIIDDLINLALLIPAQIQFDSDKVKIDYSDLSAVFQKCIVDADAMVQDEGIAIYLQFQFCSESVDSVAGANSLDDY